MTACKITAGLDCASCNDIRTKSGLYKEFYLINIDSLDVNTGFNGITFSTADDGTTYISDITLDAYETAFKFCAKKNGSGYVYELQRTDGGYVFWNATLTGQFLGTDAAARAVYDELIGGNFMAIVQDFNARYWVLAYAEGLEVTVGSFSSGVAPGDLAGFTFTLGGTEDLLPYQLNKGTPAETLAFLEGLL